MTDRDALADSVAAVRFPSERLRRGYAASDVDAFLTDLAIALRAGVGVRGPIDAARFKQALGGYDMSAVDDFLDRTAAAAATAPGGSELPPPGPDAPAEPPSAISRGDGAAATPTRVVPVVVTIVTCGVVAGIVALVVRNVRPESSFPVWPTVLVGCVVGLLYEIVTALVAARRR